MVRLIITVRWIHDCKLKKNAKRMVLYYLFPANNIQFNKNIKFVSAVMPRVPSKSITHFSFKGFNLCRDGNGNYN
jgi:hypothetical protein